MANQVGDPYMGFCPSEVLSDAVFSFEMRFTWQNRIAHPTPLELVSPLLRAGFWNIYYTQESPVSWTATRPGFGALWILGNYKINGTGISGSLVDLADPFNDVSLATAVGEIGPFVTTIGSFLIFP